MRRPESRPRALLEGAGALGIGVTAFLILYGTGPLDIRSLDWLMSGDSIVCTLGWLFFKAEPWHFPLVRIETLIWPIGTNLLQSDAIPLFSVVAKLLPVAGTAQFFGWWLVSTYVLQAVLAWRILALFTTSSALRALGTIHLTFSPVLIHRAAHWALCAHWTILFFLWLALAQSRAFRRGEPLPFPWISILAVDVFLSGVHPYLLFTGMALTAGAYAASWRTGSRPARSLAWRFAVTCVTVSLAASLLGYLEVSEPSAPKWGYFSTDLLALLSSGGLSSVLPRIRDRGGVSEGYAYLGLGGLFLVGTAFFIRRRDRAAFRTRLAQHVHPAFFFGFLALAALSFSPHLKFGGNTIVDLSWLYFPVLKILDVFRATGRFIWPFYYLLVALLLLVPIASLDRRKAITVLSVVIALQWIDMGKWWLRRDARVSQAVPSPLVSEVWKAEAARARTLYLVPPYIPAESYDCHLAQGFDLPDYRAFGLYAAGAGMRLNSAFVSRAPSAKVKAYCESFLAELERGTLDSQGLYVVRPAFRRLFEGKPGVECRNIDGYTVCAPRAQ